MKFISNFLEKWKSHKWNKMDWMICLLGGILLLVIAIPTEKEDSIKESESIGQRNLEESQENYKENLEKELESLLKKVAGAGEVKVMITLKDEGEVILDKNTKSDENSFEQETVQFEAKDGTTPYVTNRIVPAIEGVVVVAEGGNNSAVRTNLTETVLALFSVDSHKVKIVPMNQE